MNYLGLPDWNKFNADIGVLFPQYDWTFESLRSGYNYFRFSCEVTPEIYEGLEALREKYSLSLSIRRIHGLYYDINFVY
jgi:hypothetical protein